MHKQERRAMGAWKDEAKKAIRREEEERAPAGTPVDKT
jgi:hypothetical protein